MGNDLRLIYTVVAVCAAAVISNLIGGSTGVIVGTLLGIMTGGVTVYLLHPFRDELKKMMELLEDDEDELRKNSLTLTALVSGMIVGCVIINLLSPEIANYAGGAVAAFIFCTIVSKAR